MENSWSDTLRILVLVLGSGVVGVALVVVAVYARAYWLFHRRLTKSAKWRGLLPVHVVTIGLSYLILVIGSMVEMSARVQGEFTWRLPVYLVANVFGLWALWDVLGFQRARLTNLTPPLATDDLDESGPETP